MKPKSEIHYVSPSYKLDVTMVIGSKSDKPEYGRMLTEPQIATNLHKYCPHIMAITGVAPVVKGDYSKKKVTGIASVKNVKSTGRAIDIVMKEIEDKLDSVYTIHSARVKAR